VADYAVRSAKPPKGPNGISLRSRNDDSGNTYFSPCNNTFIAPSFPLSAPSSARKRDPFWGWPITAVRSAKPPKVKNGFPRFRGNDGGGAGPLGGSRASAAKCFVPPSRPGQSLPQGHAVPNTAVRPTGSSLLPNWAKPRAAYRLPLEGLPQPYWQRLCKSGSCNRNRLWAPGPGPVRR